MDDVRQELRRMKARMRLQALVSLGILACITMAVGGSEAVARGLTESDSWFVKTLNASSALTNRITVSSGENQCRIKLSAAHLELAQQSSAPATPAAGAFWYDSTANVLKSRANGTAWIEMGGVINRVASTVTIGGSTETTIYSYTVPANTMGTNKALRLTMIGDRLNDSGATKTITLRVKFGGTTLYQDVTATFADANLNRYPWNATVVLANQDATNAQTLGGQINFGINTTVPATGFGDLGVDEIIAATPFVGVAGTIDTTQDRLLEVTVQHSASHASNNIRLHYALLELK